MCYNKLMQEKQFSKIINNGTINLYRGCTHGCIYCDSRSACYGIMDFENIIVKQNAIAMLEQELKSKRKKTVLHTGSMTDPYIHLEQKLQLTRQMLELIYKHGFGIKLITKSNLVLRDVDILKKISNTTFARVDITITTFDDELCKIIEPATSITSERFSAIKTLIDNGIDVCVWLCPILPFINDTAENVADIVNKCAEVGVKRIIAFSTGVTLREGSREYFYKMLDKYFPGVKEKYQSAFGFNYICKSPNSKELWEVFTSLCNKHGINYNNKDNFSHGNDLIFSNQFSFFD